MHHEVSESPEHKALRDSAVKTTLVYLGLQQRTPEPGGFAFWTGRLDDDAVAAAAADGVDGAGESPAVVSADLLLLALDDMGCGRSTDRRTRR